MGIWEAIKKKRAISIIGGSGWIRGLEPDSLSALDTYHIEAIASAARIVPEDDDARRLFNAAAPVFSATGFDARLLTRDGWEELAHELRRQILELVRGPCDDLAERIRDALPAGLSIDATGLTDALVAAVATGEPIDVGTQRLAAEATHPPFPYCPGLDAWLAARTRKSCDLVARGEIWTAHPGLEPDHVVIHATASSDRNVWRQPADIADSVLERVRKNPVYFSRNYDDWLATRLEGILADVMPKLSGELADGETIDADKILKKMTNLASDKPLDELGERLNSMAQSIEAIFAANREYFIVVTKQTAAAPPLEFKLSADAIRMLQRGAGDSDEAMAAGSASVFDRELLESLKVLNRNSPLQRGGGDSDEAMAASFRPPLKGLR